MAALYDGEFYFMDQNNRLTKVINTILFVAFALATISCCLNLFIIVTVMDYKLRAHLKFVLSLTFADLLLAIFYIVLRFRKYPTLPNLFLGIDTEIFNMFEEIRKLGQQNIGNNTRPIKINVNETLNQTFSEMTYYKEIDVYVLFEQQFNDRVGLKSNLLDNILASLYLVPNATAPLSMLMSTMSLLVAVTKPLQFHVILSRRRGNLLVCSIWAISFAVAVTAIGLTMDKPIYEVENIIFNYFSFVYEGTVVTLAILPVVYIVIIVFLRRMKFKHPARTAVHRKATMTAIAVITTYAACNLPIVWIVIFGSATNIPLLQTAIFQTLFIINTIFDPIIYAVRLSEVHAHCRKISKNSRNMFNC